MKNFSFKTISGIYLVLLGLGFLLSQLGIVDFGLILGVWWPTYIIVASGIFSLLSRSHSPWGALIIILLGLLLQLRELEVIAFNFWGLFWPAIIILIGLGMIFTFGKKAKTSGEDDINYTAIFSGLEKKLISRAFTGGTVTVLFGGAEIDLREAQIAEAGAEIRVFTAFGGTDILVPKGWEVVTSGMPIFGAFSNKTSPGEAKGKLVVKGTALFGGVGVKNEKD